MIFKYAILFLLSMGVCAHEIRPAYLQINDMGTNSYNVLWKLPTNGRSVPDITPVFEKGFNLEDTGTEIILDGYVAYRYKLGANKPLEGTKLSIQNHGHTTVDVLVDIRGKDGNENTFMLQPTNPEKVIPQAPSKLEVAYTYAFLGVEHILLGIDHLLFVLALVLLTKGFGKTVKTVTAFTVAHSITLSAAVLGFVGVPGKPVEAVIALSIVFLAWEILRYKEGKDSLTVKSPWIVAFSFGLLHGFGFAGALSEIGLPQSSITLALAAFNFGVELGQVFFICVSLVFMRLVLTHVSWSPVMRRVPAYGIGAVGAFWLIERVVSF